MESENLFQLILGSRNLLIFNDSNLERWSFNSYLHGYHECIDILVSLIGDDSLVCRRKDGNKHEP